MTLIKACGDVSVLTVTEGACHQVAGAYGWYRDSVVVILECFDIQDTRVAVTLTTP